MQCKMTFSGWLYQTSFIVEPQCLYPGDIHPRYHHLDVTHHNVARMNDHKKQLIFFSQDNILEKQIWGVYVYINIIYILIYIYNVYILIYIYLNDMLYFSFPKHFFSSRSEVFLVGCGALGCEYLKGLALMGLAATDSVVSLWTSPWNILDWDMGAGTIWYHLVPFLVTCPFLVPFLVYNMVPCW